MTILRFVNESRPLEMLDDIIGCWSKIVVPIFVQDENSNHKVSGLGSAFIVQRKRKVFLVTARHVLLDIADGDALMAVIAGKAVLLNGLYFFVSVEDDLAIAFLEPFWAEKQHIERMFSLPLDVHEPTWQLSDIFVLLGYPGSRNKLNINTNDTDRNLVSYSSTECIENPKAKTHIQNPIAFYFDKKKATDTDEKRINVGLFNGVSGGPVLQVRGRDEGDREVKFSVSLAGVFVGWDKQHKELVCVRSGVVEKLIDERIEKSLRRRGESMS